MYVTTDTLYHHGIKGQRWGVRRFQNEDGTRTAAGKRRYYADVDGAIERVATAKGAVQGTKGAAREKAKQRVQWEKEKLKNEKIKNRLNSEKSKSAHRLKLEEQYRNKGMSDEEAAVAAYKRARTEKIIAGTAALGVAAAASYVAYRHYDRSVDKFIKSDTIMKRVASTDSTSVHDAFYASMGKGDAKKYVGLYGTKIEGDGKDVFQKTIRVKDSLKVASEKSATNALKEIISNDPSYKKSLHSDLETFQKQLVFAGPKQKKIVEKALEALSKDNVDSNVYEALNLDLVNRTESGKRFFDHMRSKGYDAIADINDKRKSGYRAKTATIVFSPSKVTVDKVRAVNGSEIDKSLMDFVRTNKIRQETLKTLPYLGIGAAIRSGKKVSQTKKRDTIVAEYKKQHPNTTLSYNEIVDNYYQK